MGDARLRELERRWRETGAPADALAYREAQRRRGERCVAVIGCLHANLAAAEAVFADIEAEGIADVICLGDLVGYGPDPVEVVDLVRERCRVVLCGNHDEAVVRGAYNFGIFARRSVDWARTRLQPGWFSGRAARARWRFLEGLAERHVDGPDLFVHGSPRDPMYEYILPHDCGWAWEGALVKLAEVFAAFERLLFVAHSHLPGLVREDFTHATPADLGHTYVHEEGKAIVNVGSVGQPRDGDTRASYAILEGRRIRWKRVAYDLERTMARIRANSQLADIFAERLTEGK